MLDVPVASTQVSYSVSTPPIRYPVPEGFLPPGGSPRPYLDCHPRHWSFIVPICSAVQALNQSKSVSSAQPVSLGSRGYHLQPRTRSELFSAREIA
jgi:hypothetical protein